VWRQDKKTLLRPHMCCNLQGNLQALSANRFAMDWGAIEASLSLHHRYHSDSQWKDVERCGKAAKGKSNSHPGGKNDIVARG
jgi:hypothetical protein